LIRIPFSASVIWAVFTTITAPQPPPQLDEKVEATGLEVLVMPLFVKAWSLTLGIAEILVILANLKPANSFSRFVMTALVYSPAQTPAQIHLTWPFIFAWICTILGALIRRSCYRTLGRMFTFELSVRKNHQLVTSGPYSVVRHPSYTGGVMALLGALMCHTSPGSWFIECSGIFNLSCLKYVVAACWLIATVVGSLVIVPRLKKEDDML
ncbi:hypothetical protein B0H34DRAFT_686959, partial [Crassisporium funariophilum]